MTISNSRHQYDDALLSDIQELIEIRARGGQRYLDEASGRYREFSTGKIVSKTKVEADYVRRKRLLSHVTSNMKFGNVFDVAFSDYFPELALGRMNDSAMWFYEIGSGQRPYARRSASDRTVIEHGSDLVNALLAVNEIDCGIASGVITQVVPLAWYEGNATLYAYSKTAPVLDKLERTSIHNAMILLLKAKEDGKPQPSRLELWLAMNPRELFTTDEGRMERDRQAARLNQGETTL